MARINTKTELSTKAIAIGAITMLVLAGIFVWLLSNDNSPITLEIIGSTTQVIDLNDTAVFTIRANNTDMNLNHSVNLTINYDTTKWSAYLSVWNLNISAGNWTDFFLFVIPTGATYGDSVNVSIWGIDDINRTTNTVYANVNIITLPTPPNADFTWSPVIPTDLDNIQFTDLSTDADGTIIAWYWDFGDGTNSTEQNPQKQYSDNGDYTVSLTVWDDDGLSDSVSYNLSVLNVKPSVKIDFPSENDIVSGIINIQGNANDLDGNVVEVQVRIDNGTWQLANGTNNWNFNLDTTTLSNGNHTIEAISRDDDNEYSAIDSVNFTINNPPPANFKGYIYDNSTGLPIENVFVIAVGFGGNATFTRTDASGYYELSIPRMIEDKNWGFFFIVGQHQINGTFDYLMHFKGQLGLRENETRWYNFTMYPMPSDAYNNMLYGYVYAENGTPLQNIGILAYDLNYPNSILPWMLGVNTNESGYYERPIYNGTFLVGFNLMIGNEIQVQGNLSQITINGSTNVSRTLLPSSEGGTINATFLNGWDNIAVEGWFWTNRDAETFRFMWDFLVGNGNGIFEQEELDLLLQIMIQFLQGPDNTTDMLTVDNLFYDTTYWNFTFEVEFGSVLLKTPAEMVMRLNGTINGTIPTQSTHVIKANFSYDDAEDGPTNATWYIYLPSGYVLVNYSQTSAVVSGVGTNVIIVDPGNDPNITDNITSEWIEFYTTIPPTADFTYSPSNPTTAVVINFIDNSTDADGTIINWYWDFGDGTNSTEQNPQKQYSDDITYTVSLRVWDDTGATDTISKQITIGNSPPTVAITYPNEWDFVNGIVNILGIASDDDPLTIEVRIIGINYDTNWNLANGTNNWNYIWNTTSIKNGVYKIQARIIDDDNASSIDEIMVIVNNTIEGNYPPTVEITSPLNNEAVSGTITISGEANDSDGNVIIVLVRIDNGSWSLATGTNNWNYIWDTQTVSNGNHTISAKSVDNNGASSNIYSINVIVNNTIPNVPPNADFNWIQNAPLTIQFIDNSTDADGTIINWTWDFGDGDISYQQNPTHVYSSPGIYLVSLTVRDDDDAFDTISKFVVVSNYIPTISIDAPNEGNIVNGTVIISGEANDTDGNVVIVLVRIDNGSWNLATGTNNWQYIWDSTTVANGNHSIFARAFDNNGASSLIAIVNITVDNNALPNADFNFTPENPKEDEEIQFNDLSSDRDGTIINWTWDFGDGDISYKQNPKHIYNNAGIYLVKLTVRDNRNGEDSIEKVVIVQSVVNIPPEVNITSPTNFEIVKGAIVIKGNANDSDGNVQKVEIAVDNGSWQLANGTNNWSYSFDTTTISDGTHIIYARATDNNNASTTTFVIVIVDNTPPNTTYLLLGTLGSNNWYVSDVQVILIAKDNTSGVNQTYYKFWQNGTSEPPNYSKGNEFSINQDGIWNIKYYSDDKAKNNENAKTTQVRIDKSPPYNLLILINDDEPYTRLTSVNLRLSANDNTSGLWQMQFSNDGAIWSGWEGYANSKGWILTSGDGTKTVYFKVKDKAGNIAEIVSDSIILDTTPPTTSYSLTGILGSNNWYVSNVKINLTATDSSSSGVNQTYYRINGGSWQIYNNPFTLSIEGNNTIDFYSTDNADNQEPMQTITVKIDKTKPTTTDNVPSGWQNTFITITLTPSDTYSNVDKTYYKKWLTTEPEPTYYVEGGTIYLNQDGIWNIKYYSVDKAGNSETPNTNKVQIDTSIPNITHTFIGPNYTIDSTVYITPNTNIKLTATDSQSGIKRIEYRIDGSWQTYTSPFNITTEGNYIVYYRAIDNAGNTETKTININLTSISIVIDEGKLKALLKQKFVLNAGQSYEKLFKLDEIFISFGNAINYSYIAEPDWAVIVIIDDDSWVSIYPALNYSGTVQITFIAEQGTRATSQSFTLPIYINYVPHGVNVNGISLKEKEITSLREDYAKDEINFTVSVSDSIGKTFNYIWDFGEGKPIITTNNSQITYSYDKDGIYIITLTIEYPANKTSATYSMIILIKDNIPTPNFIIIPLNATAYTNQPIKFNASSSTDKDGSIVLYVWQFGDGSSSIGEIVEHRYIKEGNYSVVLLITDDFGNTNKIERKITIIKSVVDVYLLPEKVSVKIGEEVVFSARATSTGNYSKIVSYKWDFGDGTIGEGQNVKHVFANAGEYIVNLTVENEIGESATKTITITVVEKVAPDYTWLYIVLVIILAIIILAIILYFRRKPTEIPPELEEELPIKPPTVPEVKEEEKKVEMEKIGEEMFECSNCGALVMESATSCPSCGAIFEEEKKEIEEKKTEESREEKEIEEKKTEESREEKE